MSNQYFVQEHGYYERAAFYDYIHNNFKVKDKFFNRDRMCTSNFPFVVDFSDNFLTVCESITCCALAAQRKRIISVDEFKKEV